MSTVWQAKWLLPTIEPGPMLTEKGDRLWLRIKLTDFTGTTTTAMNEKTALALSGHDTKDEFIQAVRDGDPVFPSLMSAKLVRKIKTLNDEDGTPSETYVNINILEASPQEFTHARTKSCVELIDMLRTKGITASSVLPASLGMTTQSKLHPLLVQYPVEGLAPVSC